MPSTSSYCFRRPLRQSAYFAAAIIGILGIVLSLSSSANGSDWRAIDVPGTWEEQPAAMAPDHDGYAWYRCNVRIPVGWQGRDVLLVMGEVDNCYEVFFNGARVGGQGAFPPAYQNGLAPARRFLVGSGLLKPGEKNLIAVRVYDDGGRGGFKGAAPVVLQGDESISLQGKWQFRTGDQTAWEREPLGSDETLFTFDKILPASALHVKAEFMSPSPADSLAMIRTPSDLAVDLVLHEPTITQPVFLNFDERGRMWVVEYRQYPHPAGLHIVSRDQFWRNIYDKIPAPPPHHDRGMDRISIHEDADHDGTFESSKTFVDGLNMVTSVERGRGGVWVLNPPYLLFYPDANQDDVPDGDPTVHLSGFWLEDSHSIANSLRWGPDGWLYGAQGSTVSADIRVSGDVRTLPVHTLGQLIWRYHPEQHRFEIWAEGGGNAFGCEIDNKGRIFSGHNGGDTRGFHYPQHGYLQKGFNKHGPLSNPYAFGYFPYMPHNQVARFTHNFEIYQGDGLPNSYHGKLFGVDPLNQNIPIAEITPDGATFSTHDIDLALSTTDKWFRPVDIKSGPDGALYLCDWCDFQVAHLYAHQGNMDKASGRIYRIRGKSQHLGVTVDFSTMSIAELMQSLEHPNRWHRQTARRVLADRRAEASALELQRNTLASTGQLALETLWATNLCGGFDESFARQTLHHADPYVRLWTVRLLGDMRAIKTQTAADLARLATHESHVEVRSQLASTAKRLTATQAIPIIAGLVGHESDKQDRYVPLQIWWAIESKCGDHGDTIVSLLDSPEFRDAPLVREHLLSRIMQRFAATGKRSDLRRCARLLELSPDAAATEQFLRGFEQAYVGRPIDDLPPELISALAKSGGGALPLRLRQRDPQAVAEALQMIRDESSPAAKRVELITVFGQVNVEESPSVMLDLLAATPDPSIRRAILGALQLYRSPNIATVVLGHYADWPADDQHVAANLLTSRAAWTVVLLQAVADGKVDRHSLSVEALRRAKLHQDPAIDGRIAELFGDISGETTEAMRQRIQQVQQIVTSRGGDPYAGQRLFREHCAKCHYLFNEGGHVGPDLTAYQRQNLETMLLHLINPSAEIREGFENYTIETIDGRLLTGVVADRDAQGITMRNAEGQLTTLSSDQIEAMRVNPISLMPEGLLNQLNDEQLANLFAYLRSTQPLAN